MKYINHLSLTYLLVGLIFGYSVGYFFFPEIKTIIKYAKNKNDLVYKDETDKCYKVVKEEIKCPKSNDIIEHPIILN